MNRISIQRMGSQQGNLERRRLTHLTGKGKNEDTIQVVKSTREFLKLFFYYYYFFKYNYFAKCTYMLVLGARFYN